MSYCSAVYFCFFFSTLFTFGGCERIIGILPNCFPFLVLAKASLCSLYLFLSSSSFSFDSSWFYLRSSPLIFFFIYLKPSGSSYSYYSNSSRCCRIICSTSFNMATLVILLILAYSCSLCLFDSGFDAMNSFRVNSRIEWSRSGDRLSTVLS